MQADLRPCWSHIPHCWISHVAAHFALTAIRNPVFAICSIVLDIFIDILFC